MWFKNLQVFRFSEAFTETADNLNEKLAALRFQPCRSVDAQSQGWIAPQAELGETFVYAINGLLLLCLKTEEKIVPGVVVKQMLEQKIMELEKGQNRSVNKREKENLKADIYHHLVTRAFSKISYLYGYIDTQAGLLIVDAPSHQKAEVLTVMLRQSLGSLKIELPSLKPISTLLTEWLKNNDYPVEFSIEDTCILKDDKQEGSIRCQRQNLFAEEIQTLLENGRFVSQLNLSWSERVSFVLKEDFAIKSLKFLELVQDEAQDIFTETKLARFEADFTIMAETLRHLLQDLLKTFAIQD